MTRGKVRRVSTKTFPRQRLRASVQASASPNGRMQTVLSAHTARVKRIMFHSLSPKKLTARYRNPGVGKFGGILRFLETQGTVAPDLDGESRPELLPDKQFSVRIPPESAAQSSLSPKLSHQFYKRNLHRHFPPQLSPEWRARFP